MIWFKIPRKDEYKTPKLKQPIIILCKDQYTTTPTYTVLFHPRKYGVSFRGLWHGDDFMTEKSYGKVHSEIGKKVCFLNKRTVHLIDSFRIRLKKQDKFREIIELDKLIYERI